MKKIAAPILTTLVSAVCSAQPYGSVMDVERCKVDIYYNFDDKRTYQAKHRDAMKCYNILPPGLRMRMLEADRHILPGPTEINITIRVEDARCKPRKQGAATVGTPC